MSQEFKNVKVSTGRRSTFDLSHDQVTSSDFGKIIPIMCRECLPGDKWTVDPNVFVRLAPLAVPTYGRIKCRVHTFFVPNRILWRDWDNYIVGNSQSLPPYMTVSTLAQIFMLDPAFDPQVTGGTRGIFTDVCSNLGINPISICRKTVQGEEGAWISSLPTDQKINALPFLAYQRIWFDYFRDTNLNTSENWFDQFVNGGNMSDTLARQILSRRHACFKKDYFTTCKLNPQDGANAATAEVNSSLPRVAGSTGQAVVAGNYTSGKSDLSLVLQGFSSPNGVVQSISVPALRAATALQRYLERNNYVGARTISRLLAHFGVQPSAERLDMSEYVGGSDFPIQIADVTSTSLYSSSSPFGTTGLGTQAGKGVGAGDVKGCEYFCKEHGFLMSVMSIMPDSGYYQGINKMWTRGFNGDGKFEYFTPEFENLGFQPVLNRELYVPSHSNYSAYNPSQIFGYTPRYSEYKFQNDVLAGDFVNTATQSGSDCFHLFRRLYYSDVYPLSLNTNFTTLLNQSNTYDRIFQVTDNTLDHFYCDIHVKAVAERNMVDFSEPSIADVQEGEGRKVELPYGGIRL